MDSIVEGDVAKSQQSGSLQAIISKLSMGRLESRRTWGSTSPEKTLQDNVVKGSHGKETQGSCGKSRIMDAIGTSSSVSFSDEQEIQLDTEKPLLSVGNIKIEPIDPIDSDEVPQTKCQSKVTISGRHYYTSDLKNDRIVEAASRKRNDTNSGKKPGRQSATELMQGSNSNAVHTTIGIVNNGTALISCTACGLAFQSKANLDSHKQDAHQKTEIFSCQFCNKVFTHQSARKVHMRIHFDVRPFQCHLCDKRFRGSSHLKDHIRTHTGERPFVCEICGKGFKQASDLRKHRPTHLNKKKFSCRVCGCEFSRLSLFIDHMQTVHPAVHPMKDGAQKAPSSPSHLCACGKVFPSFKKLNEHFQVTHCGQSSGAAPWKSPTDKASTPTMAPVQGLVRSDASPLHSSILRGPLSPPTVVMAAAPLPPSSVLTAQPVKGVLQSSNLGTSSSVQAFTSHISPKSKSYETLSPSRITGVVSGNRVHQSTTYQVAGGAKLVPVLVNGPMATFRAQGPIITAVTGSIGKLAREQPMSGRQSADSDVTVTSASSSTRPVAPQNIGQSATLVDRTEHEDFEFSLRSNGAKSDQHRDSHDNSLQFKQVFRFPCRSETQRRPCGNHGDKKAIIHQVILIQGSSYKVLPLSLPCYSSGPSVIVINQANREEPTIQVINMEHSQETDNWPLASPHVTGSFIQRSNEARPPFLINSPTSHAAIGRSLVHGPVRSCKDLGRPESDDLNPSEYNAETTSCESEIETAAPTCPIPVIRRRTVRRNMNAVNCQDYICQKCSCHFPTRSQLQHHKLFFHQAKGVFACGQCHRSFPTRQKLANHKVIHLSSLRAKLKCFVCDKRFRKERSLVHHVMAKHEGKNLITQFKDGANQNSSVASGQCINAINVNCESSEKPCKEGSRNIKQTPKLSDLQNEIYPNQDKDQGDIGLKA